MVRSAVPISGVKKLAGDWRDAVSLDVLGSRSDGDDIVHGVVASVSATWFDCNFIGRRQPSKAILISENLIGLDDRCAHDVMTS